MIFWIHCRKSNRFEQYSMCSDCCVLNVYCLFFIHLSVVHVCFDLTILLIHIISPLSPLLFSAFTQLELFQSCRLRNVFQLQLWLFCVIYICYCLLENDLFSLSSLIFCNYATLGLKGRKVCSQTNGQGSYISSDSNVIQLSGYISTVYSVILVLCVVSWAGRNRIIFLSRVIFCWLQSCPQELKFPSRPYSSHSWIISARDRCVLGFIDIMRDECMEGKMSPVVKVLWFILGC